MLGCPLRLDVVRTRFWLALNEVQRAELARQRLARRPVVFMILKFSTIGICGNTVVLCELAKSIKIADHACLWY